jgi:hypothetical protein
MAIPYTEVRPGEIISSDLINYILDELEDLDERVAALETGGTPAEQVQITGFDPSNQVEAGQILSVLGKNFAFPPSSNAVTIDDTSVTSFRPDSTGSELKFVVPTSLVVPTGGKNFRITVSNSKGSDEKLYRILPAVAATGDPPVITNVAAADGGPFIFVEQDIRITGQNFADDPTENIITFTVTTGPGEEVVYPKSGETLNIDTGQSSTTEIVVTVPDIEEILSGTGNNPVTLEVGVGAHVPDAEVIQVRR